MIDSYTRLVACVTVLLLIGMGCAADTRKVAFKKHVISQEYLSEGVAVADVNNNGRTDVIAGSYWFEAPDWTPHAFRPVKTFPDTTWGDAFGNHAVDVNGNGWTDIVRVDFPGKGAYWYENPRGKNGYWKRRPIHSAVNNESPRFVDVEGDGRDDLLFADGENQQMVWLKASGASKKNFWKQHPISKKKAPGTSRFSHGLGLGDINGDNRKDVIIRQGWWEAPAAATSSGWTFHPADLGEPAAQMYAYDFDGDGDNDVVSSSAHDYGIWWHEQKKDDQGKRSWTRHLIHDDFSQTHGLVLRDINGDDLPDLVTGKRYFAHNGKDPGGLEPPVLYWFELARENGQVKWVPHQIDNSSGVGVELVVEDITDDSYPDIIVSNKKGVFLFEQVSN